MPIFTYQCQKCKHEFDLLVGVNMEKESFKCPKCGSKKIDKFIASSVSVGTPKSSGSCSTGSCSTGTCPTCPGF